MSSYPSKRETLASLPTPRAEALLPAIRSQLEHSKRCIVVLDDDPTGTQTVHDTPVLTRWSVEALAREMDSQTSLFYVLTNSRSLSQDAAVALAGEIGTNLVKAARQSKCVLSVVSRSDSTLRGHFPAEVDTLADALGISDAVQVICPFFLQGGRLTIDDVHYAAEGDALIPAGETPFAADATFGFKHSNLVDWVIEKRNDPTLRDTTHSLSIDSLRRDSIDSIQRQLTDLPPRSTVIVNAAAIEDVQTFALAALRAESAGKSFLYRSAASFVQAFAGLDEIELLGKETMIQPAAKAGLIVAGSYVPKTTSQLNHLIRHGENLTPIILAVQRLLNADDEDYLNTVIAQCNANLAAGKNVLLYTSRGLVTGDDAVSNLQIGSCVSQALVLVVRGISCPLRFLIAKGGITSSDVATRGLDVERAIVLGQILPGVPVWQLQDESRFPGMGYVVFPGNVGDDAALLTAYQKLC